MPKARISKQIKAELLSRIRKGHDLESAAAFLELSDAQTAMFREKYQDEIAAAFKIGTAWLRSFSIDFALEKGDAHVLAQEVERRESRHAGTVFTSIEYRIVSPVPQPDLPPLEKRQEQPEDPEPDKPAAPVEPIRRSYQGRIWDPGTRRFRDVDPLTYKFI